MSTVSVSSPAPSGSLALAFQEVFTAVVRIRAAGVPQNQEDVRGRSQRAAVADAASFRRYMREAITKAVAEAKRYSYTDRDIEFAMLAAVGFLDETILNSGDPVFADWHRDTLCN